MRTITGLCPAQNPVHNITDNLSSDKCSKRGTLKGGASLERIRSLISKRSLPDVQKGINLVDLMIWVIIASFLAANAFQALSMYRTASVIYQMKSDIRGVVDLAAAKGVYTGRIQDPEVAGAVNTSLKSAGVTITWGKFSLVAETPPPDTTTTASAQDSANSLSYQLAAAVTSTGGALPAAVVDEGETYNTYVLVARHPDAPNIRVVYFFDDVDVYKSGSEVIGINDLPPIQDMFDITPDPDQVTTQPSATPTPTATTSTAPVPTTDPTSTATAAPTETVTPTPGTTADPTPTPTTTTTSPSPTPTPTSTTDATTAPATSDPAVAPAVVSPSPTATSSPSPTPTPTPLYTQDPTPEPQPLIPAANYDKKTKKFLFCHDGMMHSNSYTGMIQGHQNHPDDIMPPIPAQNYPGHNWTTQTAKVYYNNCVPFNS